MTASISSAQAPAGGTVSFTAEQADRGEDAYMANCAGCHGISLGGEGEAPGVVGTGFRNRWFSEAGAKFFDFLSTRMPQQDPGSLEPQVYADIMAFLMEKNRIPAGTTELPADPAVLATLTYAPTP